MALGFGDPILMGIAWPQNGVSQPAITTGGSGSNICFGCGASAFQMNNGFAMAVNDNLVREVAPGTSGLFGKMVQVAGFGASFRGAVIAELQVEIGTTGGTGALTECVLVQGPSFRFLALASAVEEVS